MKAFAPNARLAAPIPGKTQFEKTEKANHAEGYKTSVVQRRPARRHVTGDWGELPVEDRTENYISMKQSFRALSSYRTLAGDTIWVITEADRSLATLLLPDEIDCIAIT